VYGVRLPTSALPTISLRPAMLHSLTTGTYMLQEELSLSPHAGHSRHERQHVAAARPARAEATRLADEAAHGLARNRPDLSAHIVITVPQKLALAALLGV